ncbi:alpha/beta fold hydrolase [Bordetella sp. 2513F-2]
MNRRTLLRAAGTLAAIAAAPGLARAGATTLRKVRSSASDAVELAVYETGNPSARSVIFIHGYSQSHASWVRQLDDPGLRQALHMVAFDLRGHGESGKPMTAEAYRDPRRWADDLASVIRATCRTPPCLVGWSYAGRVINDYLCVYGDAAIAGIDYVSATSTSAPGTLGRSAALMRPLASEDPAVADAAIEPFLRACFERQPTPEAMAQMVRFNRQTPPAVRRYLGGRPADYDAVLRRVRKPVLVSHGELDQISAVAMSRHTASLIPQALLSLYPGIGHACFYEDPQRFNAELLALVDMP